MASLTFAQAKTLVAPFITYAGSTDPVVASAINFCNERFISSGQWRGNRFFVTLTASQDSSGNFYVDTAPGIESIMKVIAIDPTYLTGETGDVMSDWWQFNNGSLGWLPANYTGDLQFIREGNVPSYALPSGDGSGHYTADTQRYRVIGQVPETRQLLCLVRRGYVPLVNDNDRLIPSNRNAYRYGVQAYNYENINELERAQLYWNLAYQCLNEETQAMEDGEEAQVDIQMKAFAPSAIQNLV
jgi:hypothetical protein